MKNKMKSIKGITVKKGFKTRFLEKFNPIRKLYEKVSKIGQSENLLSLPPVIENYRRKVNIIDKYNNAKEELKNAEGKLKNAKTKEEKEVARKAVQKARDEMLKYDRGPKKTSKNFKDAMKFTPTTSGEKTTSEKEAWGEKTKIITEPEQSEDIPFSSVDLDDSSDGR